MAYSHVSEDGLVRSNDPAFTAEWNDIARKQRVYRAAWVQAMLDKGAKIITPDDGWVRRDSHTVTPPSYADVNCKAYPGDLIALGAPEAWRIVRISMVSFGGILIDRVYSFDPAAVEVSA